MVKLLKKDEETIEIFTGSTSNPDVLSWVDQKLMHYESAREVFGLNEAHSCNACLIGVSNDIISITGDEDSSTLYIEEYEPVSMKAVDPEIDAKFNEIKDALVTLQSGESITLELRKN